MQARTKCRNGHLHNPVAQLRLDAKGAAGGGSKHTWAMEDRGREAASDFGALLRQHRLAAGLSQEALAERARLSPYGISALERGYRRTPQRETVALLAGALVLNEEQRLAFEATAARPGPSRPRVDSPVTVGPWPSAGDAILPLSLTRFIGRKVNLDEIVALVREHRFVTITGAGGVGKTQTALRAASILGKAEEIAVCFAGLASIGDPSLVAIAIATAVGVQEVPNRPPLDTLVAFLKCKNMLLVLDNCEHVISEAASVVDSLLTACPRLRILATSREPIRAAGERAYRLPSLEEDDAIALFTDRAQAADVHFVLTDENRPMVREICARLDGIALAIELAAARVTVLSVKQLAEGLNDRFRILSGGERNALTRQHTMRAAIDWSYELLTTSEQRLFERLSVFASSWTLDIAISVCATDGVGEGDVFDLLSRLVDKSIVVTSFGDPEPRYRLLEPFREYAREKLTIRGEAAVLRHRHAAAMLRAAESRNRFEHWNSAERCHRRAQPEAGDWRAAVQWTLLKRHDAELGQRLAGELVTWGSFQGVEGRRWVDAALNLINDHTPASVKASLYLADAMNAEVLMLHEVELTRSLQALAAYRELADNREIARSLAFAAHASFYLGRNTEAQLQIDEAVAVARTLQGGFRLALAYALRVAARDGGADAETVRRLFAEAFEIYEQFGERTNIVYTLLDLAACEFRTGNAQLALYNAEEALTGAVDLQRTGHAACFALNDMSLYLFAVGRYDEAIARSREALRLAREPQWDVLVACALENLAAVAVLRDNGSVPKIRQRYVNAARVTGFVDAQLGRSGSIRDPIMQPRYDKLLLLLRDKLGDEFAQLRSEGTAMTEDEAVYRATELMTA
jgi:predicted ATPase/transcriptional regulator with XRE-family HTH domain